MNAPAINIKPAKAKRCRYCKQQFIPARPMQSVCDWQCGHALVLKRKADVRSKAEKEDIKKRKEAAKRPKTLKAEAQAAFNAYIRARDILAGHGCIDCGKPFEPQKPGGSIDAGHYLSRGSAPHLKFDERNVHAQRKNCNRPGGATAADYRAGLIARIGLNAVEALEADQEQRRYRDDDYRRIRDEYRAKLKAMA